ncbi:serine/threonine-protein kinase [Cellulomonas sp. ATA003]|uniref:serine/threonine-protein kinase n=1 Tax=Cellulomonas sp. ATA003 TaxID=3073064 RepID=UPI002872E3B8|nr:serine/threonine-protein kinase [Cellulomonas sp. ATA003]WNB85963.1 serine/threonine-protein kinase [Cellulomonas sp. ATA003]
MTVPRRPSAPPEIPGHTVGRLLGMGGFADVYLYTQHLPRRPVAVKVLPADSLDADVLARFGTEADLMAQLSHHPSIVTIHHAAVAADGRPYLVMEYCARPGLGARYRSERISVAEALRIGIRLASAVETAHRAGILHRDIKPANVLTTDFGWPALTDFGIAATTGWSGGAAVGMSIPWSPPELLAAVPDGDVRADVYSLAATVYSLLAGRSPFEVPGSANGAADLVARIERDPLPRTGRTDVPPSLHAALARAMEKNPVHRFHSALALARALQAVELELMLPGTPVELAQEGTDETAGPVTRSGAAPHAPADDAATRLRPVVSIDPEGDDAADDEPGRPQRTAAEEAATVTRRRPIASITPDAEPVHVGPCPHAAGPSTPATGVPVLPSFTVPAAADEHAGDAHDDPEVAPGPGPPGRGASSPRSRAPPSWPRSRPRPPSRSAPATRTSPSPPSPPRRPRRPRSSPRCRLRSTSASPRGPTAR